MKPRRGSSPVRIAAVLVLAAAAGIAVWLLAVRHSSSSGPAGRSAVAVSQQGLETLASLGRPIYWAGAKPGDTYELTQSPDGRVYIRYLPPGVELGSTSIELTVATYPFANAYAATKRIAREAGSVTIPAKDGGIAFYRSGLPTNVYLAYPGSAYQVEVFDPSASEAHRLVASGEIRAVAGAKQSQASVPKTAAHAASPADLRKLASRLGRPLYWAGETPGRTYELTETPDGRVYVRYLPAGVAAGSSHPYLTVGTYPVANAYAITKSAARRDGAVTIPVAGGVAFYNESLPTSVYLAFPGVDEQVEVYDPSAGAARAAVASRGIHAVS